MSLIRAATTVGGFTLMSRLVGFVRDLLMARYLGAGFASDAFLIAFRLPNLFRSLFAEGAFAAAFVPMVSARMGDGDKQAGLRSAVRFAEQALALLLPILTLFTLLMILAALPAVWLLTGGFSDGSPEKLAITAAFTQLTFPYLLLISIVSLLGGLLNALGRFWVNAAAPILLNLVMISSLLLFRAGGELEQARFLAAAVSVAGIAQLLFLAWGCRSAGALPRLVWPRITPDMRTLLRRIGPAAIGAGAVQINLLVSTMIAARFLEQGSVSFLYYADRLNQLPLGIIGIGVGVALLPTMARLIGAGKPEMAVHQQNRAIEFALLLTLPATIAFVVSAEPITRALFQQGAFTADDAAKSAAALTAFSLGLPAYILIKVLTPGFHAAGDTRTPMRIALLAIALNLVGNLTLVWPLEHVGIALATAISAWANALLLYLTLRRRGSFFVDEGLARAAPRMLGAALAMGAALWLLNDPLMVHVTGSLLQRVLALGLLVGGGAIVYFGAGYLLKAYSPAQLLNSFRRDVA
ncbi:MAG: murein biosynthesis integral membrane protein MurJ [Sandaracinobacteroides sp.]